jgi:hypothetical protein
MIYIMSDKIRPSPSQSATLYNVGLKKKGNDGNTWIVGEDKNGVKKWKLFKKPVKIGSKKSSKRATERTNFLSRGNSKQSTIQLPKITKIKKIGSLEFYGVVVGDTAYDKLNLKDGIYDCYEIDDNLLIINTELNLKVNKMITDWKWKHSGIVVGVDTGTFGFFDEEIIEEINEIVPQPIKNRRFNVQAIPAINFPMDNSFIVNTKMLVRSSRELLSDDLLNIDYGVIASTHVGDGGFDCYVIGRDTAILIGGITAEKLDMI